MSAPSGALHNFLNSKRQKEQCPKIVSSQRVEVGVSINFKKKSELEVNFNI
jgi:hypothetical protein